MLTGLINFILGKLKYIPKINTTTAFEIVVIIASIITFWEYLDILLYPTNNRHLFIFFRDPYILGKLVIIGLLILVLTNLFIWKKIETSWYIKTCYSMTIFIIFYLYIYILLNKFHQGNVEMYLENIFSNIVLVLLIVSNLHFIYILRYRYYCIPKCYLNALYMKFKLADLIILLLFILFPLLTLHFNSVRHEFFEIDKPYINLINIFYISYVYLIYFIFIVTFSVIIWLNISISYSNRCYLKNIKSKSKQFKIDFFNLEYYDLAKDFSSFLSFSSTRFLVILIGILINYELNTSRKDEFVLSYTIYNFEIYYLIILIACCLIANLINFLYIRSLILEFVDQEVGFLRERFIRHNKNFLSYHNGIDYLSKEIDLIEKNNEHIKRFLDIVDLKPIMIAEGISLVLITIKIYNLLDGTSGFGYL